MQVQVQIEVRSCVPPTHKLIDLPDCIDLPGLDASLSVFVFTFSMGLCENNVNNCTRHITASGPCNMTQVCSEVGFGKRCGNGFGLFMNA